MTAEKRIEELKAHGFSPDDEGVPNPDVEWLVTELERAREALKMIEIQADIAYRARTFGPAADWLLARCQEGLR